MVGKDVKDSTIVNELESDSKLKGIFNSFCNGFHKFGLWIIVFLMLGVGIGVHASKKYYADKLQDCITVGAMLHKEKVYAITAR